MTAGYTPDARQQLVTEVFHPSPVTTVCQKVSGWLYVVADLVESLGVWANGRKAARRLRGRA